MKKTKVQLNLKPNELYVDLCPLTLCSCLALVTSVTLAFDYVTFVHDVSHEICPYTNFCGTNASMTLTDNETPCCMPCSCTDDCAEMNGDCCPDKALPIKLSPIAKCKAVVVKRKKSDRRKYDGYIFNVPRYRVIGTCPKDENNDTLVAECEGNKTRLDHFLWTSDISGRTFENRFCALCNGLKSDEIVVWGLRTSCVSVLTSNYASLETTLLSRECDLVLELPHIETRPIQSARCFIPSKFRCNQTGLWNYRNSSIEAACETFDSPVLYFPQDTLVGIRGYVPTVFKNIYCVVCNGLNISSANHLCPLLLLESGRDESISLSILIDFVETHSVTELDKVEKHCNIDEVYDRYKKRCLTLFCPFGSRAIRGECRRIYLDLQKLNVFIQYRLKASKDFGGSQRQFDSSILEQEALGSAIVKNFKRKSGAQKQKCFSCDERVDIGGGNVTDFILQLTFYTSSVCHLDTIYTLATGVIGKKVMIKYGEEQSFSVDVVAIEKRNTYDFRVIHRWLKMHCGSHFDIYKETICPEVSVNISEVASMENQTRLRVTEIGVNDTARVCWEDYMLAMSKVHKSSSNMSRQYCLVIMLCSFLI